METSNKWSSAALNGLLLSFITIIFSLIQTVLEPKGVVAILLWIVKFGGCIYLLYYFMKQYSGQFQQITYGQSFGYGFLVCVFSSVICSCFMFLSFTLIFPDSIDKTIEQMNSILAAGSYTTEQEDAVNAIAGKLPQIMLFASLFYYIAIGAILSSILASFTKKMDPFAGSGQNEDRPETGGQTGQEE